MFLKIVNAGSCLRAVDKKGRTIADIPHHLTPAQAKEFLAARAAVEPLPADPEGRKRWAVEAFAGK